MAEDPIDRLEALSGQSVPAPDERFLDRLESDLRIEHARITPGRRRAPAWRLGWVFALAAIVIVGGIVGFDRLSADDPGVPLEVTDEGTADDEATDDGSDPQDADPVADVTPTPTPQDTEPADDLVVTAPDEPTPEPTEIERPTLTPTAPPDVRPTPTPVRTPTDVRPTPQPTPTVTRPADQPTPVPALPTAVPTLAPAPTPTPTPTPTATVRPEPAPLSLTCTVRTAGDAIGVVCEWDPLLLVDFDRYQLFRSRNGGVTGVIASRPAGGSLVYIDREMGPGDSATYLLRASKGDTVVAASPRVNVRVPAR